MIAIHHCIVLREDRSKEQALSDNEFLEVVISVGSTTATDTVEIDIPIANNLP